MDTAEFVSCFISSIHSRPVIWDSRAPRYRHADQALRAWKEIRSELSSRFSTSDLSVIDLKKKWKSLRASFNREKRLNSIRYNNDEYECTSKWKWYSNMAFLDVLDSTNTASMCSNSMDNKEYEEYAEYNGDHLELTIHYSDDEEEEVANDCKPSLDNNNLTPHEMLVQQQQSYNEPSGSCEDTAGGLHNNLYNPAEESYSKNTNGCQPKRSRSPNSPVVINGVNEASKRIKTEPGAMRSSSYVNSEDEDDIFGRLCAAKLRLVKRNKGACQIELLQILNRFVEQEQQDC